MRRLILVAASCAALAVSVTAGSAPSGAGFQQLAPADLGISFPGSQARTTYETTQYIENGGVAAGDVNGDGHIDLFFCGLKGASQLFVNRGDWQFADATIALQGALIGKYINAATFADLDGDGDLDLLCGSLTGDDVFFTNDGTGQFTVSDEIKWVQSDIGGITSFALADVDGDGDVDLYTARYLNTIARDTQTLAQVRAFTHGEIDKLLAGETPSAEFTARYTVTVDPETDAATHLVYENGLHDILYLNDGSGTLTPSAGSFFDANGAPLRTLPEDWGLTAGFRDVDRDGDPDLYVCNDFNSPDRFWINDGQGRFSPSEPIALRRTSNSSMGVDFADINNDGHQDFFVVDMLSRSHTLRKRQMGEMAPIRTEIGEITNRPQIMQNTLFLNRGDNTWTEIAQYAGVKASEWSWAPAFLDVDLDGFEDIIVTTGAVRDFTDADVIAEINQMGELTPRQWIDRQKLLPPLPMRNFVFRNNGDLTFTDQSEAWGFSERAVSGGVARVDLDGDGDLDLAINNTDSLPEIYRNEATGSRVVVRLIGEGLNTAAIGAKITLSADGVPIASREIIAGGSYASHSDQQKTFGVPSGAGALSLTVKWPDGRSTQVEGVSPHERYILDQRDADLLPGYVSPQLPSKMFHDVSKLLSHTHPEPAFNDFALQPLLPNRLSQLGPGLSWVDIDEDGDDELLVPSGAGGTLSIYANLGADGFAAFSSVEAIGDQTMVIGQPDPNGTRFFLGNANYEHPATPPVLPFQLDPQRGWQLGTPLPPLPDTVGPLAQADIDGDGDLDLFVGGRVIPGQYPRPASSHIYLNEDGNLRRSAEHSERFANVGLVSGATFGDLDRDGDPDLVLALEWGAVTVFLNEDGKFTDRTKSLGLSDYTGWWNGVALGDLNNDGMLEIIATNWGQNSKYEGSYGKKKGPLKIFYGDVDGNGVKDIIEAHYDPEIGATVPERGFSCSSRAMPFVREKMETFANFGLASLDDIYGDRLEETESLEARTLRHHVFFREADGYRAQPLPVEAQLSTALGIAVGDMDGDGHDDVFLSQNFFSVQSETPRNDGGRGLWLQGDGTGNLTAVPGHVSGVLVYGEQRGAALSDYDRDGRVDLAVAQNGAATKLFRNVSAKPGLRVSLRHRPENLHAIGALVQLTYGDTQGPVRSISAGSGYWSQESSTQVIGLSGTPVAIRVQWPDGEVASYPLPDEVDDILEIEVRRRSGVTVQARQSPTESP